ncbi:repressor [Companilactobacillus sp. RD055328]|uniref:arsenite efflux transporter metallochaperone ArsD n=1 Tax=Companilactobacillus sp. RD055328 TaxID=2916634 RepID=UPI001FC86F9A|nr:arsenite efflux transporter metallochaperone ArsD [Companilactobacillus sp. RD055328]GKQ42278.1 repressor [Companilactobacillus sp. RD055328]
MKTIEIYESAMCCSTGVCGPSVDSELLMITSVFKNLENSTDIEANRYNLSQTPDAFTDNKLILDEIKDDADKVLPITVVDGKIVKKENYPTLEELSKYTGLVFVEAPSKDSDCCG